MSKVYLWRVWFDRRYERVIGRNSTLNKITVMDEWHTHTKTFTSKLAAMRYANGLANNRGNYKNIAIEKWFGN